MFYLKNYFLPISSKITSLNIPPSLKKSDVQSVPRNIPSSVVVVVFISLKSKKNSSLQSDIEVLQEKLGCRLTLSCDVVFSKSTLLINVKSGWELLRDSPELKRGDLRKEREEEDGKN